MNSWSSANESVVVYTESSPPYQYLEGDQVKGVATDYVRKIFALANIDASIYMYPWARALISVEKSSRALIYSIAKTPERENQFIWIAPVARFELGLISLATGKTIKINDWRELKEYSIAAQRGDIAYQWLLEQGLQENEQLLACADINCSWQQLKLGTVDMIIEDPSLLKSSAAVNQLSLNEISVVKLIPELAIDAYLAANKNMDENLVLRLQEASKLILTE
jgi:polar amino acid transport system substrate-binding protein